MKGLPSGLAAGLRGLPLTSTTAIVGVAPVLTVVWLKLPLFQLSKYRKMPLRAHGVRTTAFTVWRSLTSTPSQRTKKNDLFFLTGPPKLSVY